jgi:hypothetical protein
MNESNIDNNEASVELYAKAVAAIFSFVVDCNLDESHLNAGNLWLALEYAYQSHPKFWHERF